MTYTFNDHGVCTNPTREVIAVAGRGAQRVEVEIRVAQWVNGDWFSSYGIETNRWGTHFNPGPKWKHRTPACPTQHEARLQAMVEAEERLLEHVLTYAGPVPRAIDDVATKLASLINATPHTENPMAAETKIGRGAKKKTSRKTPAKPPAAQNRNPPKTTKKKGRSKASKDAPVADAPQLKQGWDKSVCERITAMTAERQAHQSKADELVKTRSDLRRQITEARAAGDEIIEGERAEGREDDFSDAACKALSGHEKDIARWSKKITDLDSKISDARARVGELLDDQTELIMDAAGGRDLFAYAPDPKGDRGEAPTDGD